MLRTTVFTRKYFAIPDLLILLFIGTAIYGLVGIGQEWQSEFHPVTDIHLSVGSLFYYTLLSAMRGMVAYVLSLSFTLVVGYVAAKNRHAEKVILPAIDILQSIPVLGFLPGLLIALVSVFPDTNTGLEMVAVIAIFTGQVWNMVFSFYASLKSVPPDLNAAATVIGLNWWQRFTKVEMPFAAVNLAWNSVMSMAGGWFFLTVCEASKIGEREYRLPGVGAYMAVAIGRGDTRAIILGISAMIVLIVVMDFVIWRPVLSWVQRFRLEEVQTGVNSEPMMQILIRESRIVHWLKLEWRRWRFARREEAIAERREREARMRPRDVDAPAAVPKADPGRLQAGEVQALTSALDWRQRFKKARRDPVVLRWAERLVGAAIIAGLAYFVWMLFQMLAGIPVKTWIVLIRNTWWTFVRVMLAILLSTLWTVPVGIWIGTSSRRVRVAQPVIQVLASFPAPMLYPLALGVFFALGIHFDWGSMLLLMVGVQWYILFNVLAGAMRIPRELIYALDLMETTRWLKWRMLYLPSIFPTLVTGWVVAMGAAWNASMVAEVATYQGRQLSTAGLGASIMHASEAGDFQTLAASLALMVFVVVLLNRVVWAPVYQLAQTRFRMDV